MIKTEQISIKKLLLYIVTPTAVLSLCYLILGHFCSMPYILLFCLLGTVTLVPIELGIILFAGKKEYGSYTLKSALSGQVKAPVWKTLLFAFLFFSLAGLLSAFAAPLENKLLEPLRLALLSRLPVGFDWQNIDYVKSFSRPLIVFTCIYYGLFNVIIGPVTEELFFRGFLTSHFRIQNRFTPILIAILFSLYHFWLPFNNIFRILVFAPVAYVAYRQKNIYMSICLHCMCNLFSVIGFVIEVFK